MRTLLLIGMFLFQQAQPQPNGTIAGRITYRDGGPAVRVVVTANLVTAPNINGRNLSVTDESGNYRVQGVPPGAYYVRAAFGSTNLIYPGVTTEKEATSIVVAPGAAILNAEMIVPDSLTGVRVSGRVTFPPGQTATAATSRVQMSPQALSASLNAAGEFEFQHVLPGRYQIGIPGPGMQPATVLVTDKDVSGIELKVPRFVPITGSVTAEGGARPALALVFEGPNFRAGVQTQAGGTFSTQLPEGSYLVGVQGGPSAETGGSPGPFPSGYYLSSFGSPSQDLLSGLLRVTPDDAALRLSLLVAKSDGVKVAGRVTATGNDPRSDAPARVTFSSAATQLSFDAPISTDGSFEISKMMPGTYTAGVVFKSDVRSAPKTVVIPNRDFPGMEFEAPAPVEIVGRVAVDGNGPPPRFQLAFVRGGGALPNVDPNGPPNAALYDLAVMARTGAAHVLTVDVSALPDGSFRMTLPQGDYRVMPTVPGPYFIRSLTHGSSRLLTEPMHVSDSDRAELHLGFGIGAANLWKKVSGRVTGLDPAQGLARVSLESSLTATIETPVNPDGTFEFLSVLPGFSYTARLVPANDAATSPTVPVGDKDVENVAIALPREADVAIKATVEGNAPVPMFLLSFSSFTTTGGRTITTSSVSTLIKPEVDGTFKARLPQDERRVRVSGYPMGYSVKSMTYGSVDLLKNPVMLDGITPTVVNVAFAVDPSVPFGNLQGRVIGLDPDQRDVRLVLNGAGAFATFEAQVGAGGTFSFSKIPQGTYVPTLAGALTSGLLIPPSIVVTGRDLSGIEITFPKGGSKPGRSDGDQSPTGARMNDLSDLNMAPSRKAANESAAVANIRTLNTALLTYLNASGGRYGTIPNLISAGLLDSSFMNTKAGFSFSIVTVGSEYAAVAIPASSNDARYGYYANSDALIRFSPIEMLAPPRQSGNPVQ